MFGNATKAIRAYAVEQPTASQPKLMADCISHHACITGETLSLMIDTHKRFTENER